MMNFDRSALLLAVALVFGGIGNARASAVNLVQNGDFSSGLADWTQVGNWSRSYDFVQDGSLYLSNLVTQGSAGVSQTLDTVDNQAYTLSLDWEDNFEPRPGGPANSVSFQVLWDGVPIYSQSADADINNVQTLEFTVIGGGSDTLTIQGFNTLGYDIVDNVSLSTVPLPGTALLFGSGLIGLIGFGKRRVRKT